MSHASVRLVRDDEGSGGVLTLAIVAMVVCAVLAVLPLSAALAAARRAAVASDAAALAAADAVLGVVSGEPCGWAAKVAAAHRVALTACRVDGAEVVVSVRTNAGSLPVESSSRAGPPR